MKKKADVLNRVEIIADNLVNNFKVIKRESRGMKIFPVVKANAYGHGLEECVKILESQKPSYFAVDSYYEALRIKKISRVPVLIISPNSPHNVEHILRKKFTLAVTNMIVLKAVTKIQKNAKIHLAFNTGMNREGFVKDDISEIIKILQENPKIECEGIFSHLADADGNNNYTKFQEKGFSEILDLFNENDIFPDWVHLGNSAGFNKTTDPRINAFRPGLALYGFGRFQDLKPILRFVTTVTDLQKLKAGEKVSYNCTFETKKETTIALLPIGYHELFDRKLSNCGFVKYQDSFLPIVGRVCMNLIMVDTKNHNLKTGDKIVAISEISTDKNSVENIAKLTGTISYETLTRIINTHRRVIV